MNTTEVSAGDNGSEEPPPEETVAASVIESGADAKGIKASTGERVLIGILLTVVIAIAIFGVVLTLVLESRKPPNDPGGPVTEDPIEVDSALFSSTVTEPYASIEDLRKDIEELAKTFANTIILQQANTYENDDYYNTYDEFSRPDMISDTEFSRPTMISDSFAMDEKGDVASSSSEFFNGVDDFQTYQHEVGAIKNDRVKSNGAHVFAASGDRIQVWDLEGNLFETNTIKSDRINALLLNPEGNRLVVITSVYSESRRIVDHYLRTQVTIFDIEGGSLNEISQTYIDGNHVDSYSVGNNVHVVTRMRLNTYSYIDKNLMRYKQFDGLTNEEYVAAATLMAEEWIIPEFVDDVIGLVTDRDEILLSRLVGFPNSLNDFKSITQVNSFDSSKTGDEDGMELNVSKSLVFRPGNNDYVYATDDWIWVSDENLGWDLEGQDYVYQTMLLGFRLDGASSNFAAVGTIPGQLLSQFSIDFVKDGEKEYVRIAITQNQFQNFWWQPRPMPVALDFVDVANSEDRAFDGNDDVNFLAQDDDDVMDFGAQDETESRTLNEIIILEIPKAEVGSQKINELVKLSSVEVGKKHEIITAVRFFDNISYVVTFERTDPFYVLDLSDPMDPKILGELEIPGFSEFMHPIKADNSMLLTVGKDTDEDGRVTGFLISIFDSTIPNDPKLVDRLVMNSTSSSSSWDERAFRYIQVGEVGRLIIPLYTYSWNDGNFGSADTFDGFTVFGVDLNRTEMITREIDINHWEDYKTEKGCNCYSEGLPERSLVFDGNLMTMKGSSVVSTDLVSQETQWSLSLPDDESCCNY